jgi:outer membrane protein assembly factor BamD
MSRFRPTIASPSSVAGIRRVATGLLAATALLIAAACSKGFQPRKFPTTLDLFRASEHELVRKHWDNALLGFDLLAQQLPARDTLLADVYFHQGEAHAGKDEHLLAAQAYSRIIDAFPDDSLADDALLRTAREYQRLWRKPTLDAQYGETALTTYRQLMSLYPDSKLIPEAGKQVASLNDWFGQKDLENAEHYMRRKAYDSAIIYLRDIVRLYPGTPAAKAAYLHLVHAFQAINYKEDIAETCVEARRFYPGDPDIGRACAGAAVPAVTDTTRAPKAPKIPGDSTRPRVIP